jgi:hypothetical protein
VKRSRWTVLLLLTGAHALNAAAALAVAPLAPVLLDALDVRGCDAHPLDSWARVA